MTMLRTSMALVFGLALWTVPGPATAGDLCQAADEITGTISALPRVARELHAGGKLRILAVGSATMFGPEAALSPGTLTSQVLNNSPAPSPAPSTPITQEASEQAFPRRMAKILQAAIPNLDVQVVVRGGRGMTAADMLALMRQEITNGPYQLVLWQTGTVEAVKNTPPGEFTQVLLEGAELVDAAGANLMLIDPQYSRFLQANSNLDPYTQALQQTAILPGVGLFRRFDLMRAWANNGQIDLERTARPDRKRMVETLHACIGAHLARVVMAGART